MIKIKIGLNSLKTIASKYGCYQRGFSILDQLEGLGYTPQRPYGYKRYLWGFLEFLKECFYFRIIKNGT